MDEKLIGFCICTNNDDAFEDCKWYIDRLYIPKGYRVEIVPVRGAKSMCEGYNSYMLSSKAKYKVYMHQDVIIINRYFLRDAIAIFEEDEKIGMIGVIGATKLVPDAEMWNHWNVGNVDTSNGFGINHIVLNAVYKGDEKYCEVKAIDGMLMMTGCDIKWRDDLNMGWDFYDVSQSLEFLRADLKVVVPRQEEPWTVHDCGISKLLNYDSARKIVLEEYRDFFNGEYREKVFTQLAKESEGIFKVLKSVIDAGQFDELSKITGVLNGTNHLNTDIWLVINMEEIYIKERDNRVPYSFFGSQRDFYECRILYNRLKSLLRKVEHSDGREERRCVEQIKAFAAKEKISSYAISVVGQYSIVDWHGTIEKLVK